MASMDFFCRLRQDVRPSSKVQGDVHCVRIGAAESAPSPGIRRQRSSKALHGSRQTQTQSSAGSPHPPTSSRRSPERRPQQWPHFSRVWGSGIGTAGSGTQEDVFMAVEPHLRNTVDLGGSCMVFVYGGPSSGKTHTMVGDIGTPKEQGIVPRAISLALNLHQQNHVADHGDKDTDPAGRRPVAHAYLFELLGDQVYDLAPDGDSGAVGRQATCARVCRLRAASSACGHVVVDGLLPWPCHSSVVQLLSFYLRGLECRKHSSTAICFQITLLSTNGSPFATLRFVELGAPRASQHQSDGKATPPTSPLPGARGVRKGASQHASHRDASATRRGSTTIQESALTPLERAVIAKTTGQSASLASQGCALAELMSPCLEGEQDLVFLLCGRSDESHVGTLSATLRLPRLLQQMLLGGDEQGLSVEAPLKSTGRTRRGRERDQSPIVSKAAWAATASSSTSPFVSSSAGLTQNIASPPLKGQSSKGAATAAAEDDLPWMVSNESCPVYPAVKAAPMEKARPTTTLPDESIAPTLGYDNRSEDMRPEDHNALLPIVKEKYNSIFQLVLECDRIKAAIASLEQTPGNSSGAHRNKEQSVTVLVKKLERDLERQRSTLDDKSKEFNELWELCSALLRPGDTPRPMSSDRSDDIRHVVAEATRRVQGHVPQVLSQHNSGASTATATPPPETRSPIPSESVTPLDRRSPDTDNRKLATTSVPVVWPPSAPVSAPNAIPVSRPSAPTPINSDRTVPRLRIVGSLPKSEGSSRLVDPGDPRDLHCKSTARTNYSSDNVSMSPQSPVSPERQSWRSVAINAPLVGMGSCSVEPTRRTFPGSASVPALLEPSPLTRLWNQESPLPLSSAMALEESSPTSLGARIHRTWAYASTRRSEFIGSLSASCKAIPSVSTNFSTGSIRRRSSGGGSLKQLCGSASVPVATARVMSPNGASPPRATSPSAQSQARAQARASSPSAPSQSRAQARATSPSGPSRSQGQTRAASPSAPSQIRTESKRRAASPNASSTQLSPGPPADRCSGLGSVSPLATRGRYLAGFEQSPAPITPQRAYFNAPGHASVPSAFTQKDCLRVPSWCASSPETLRSTVWYSADNTLPCNAPRVLHPKQISSSHVVPGTFVSRSVPHLC